MNVKFKFFLVFFVISMGLLASGCNKFSSTSTGDPNAHSGEPPTPPDPVPGVDCGVATLRWDRNTEADLAGYRVYMGLQSGVYSTQAQISDPDVTTFTTAANLTMNLTYYFSVTAFDFAGNESARSLEVFKTITVCP